MLSPQRILSGIRESRAVLIVVLLAPAGWIATLIIGTYAEFPFADQHLTLLPFLEKVFEGRVTIGDFFAPDGIDGAHITAVPKAIFVLLAAASGWTIKLELAVSLGIALATFAMLIHISTPRENELNTGLWPSLLTSLLLFSLLQVNNWLWGYALMYFLVNALMVAVATLLYGCLKTFSRSKLFGAMALCAVASFSMAQGMFTWFAVLPSIALLAIRSGRSREVLGLWLVATSITWAVLLSLLASQPVTILLRALLENPLTAITHVRRFLGVHFVYAVELLLLPGWNVLAVMAGAGTIAVVVFVASSAYLLLKGPKEDQAKIVTWISIGLFSLIYAGVNTLARGGTIETMSAMVFTTFNAMISMYSTTLVLFPIATVQLAFLALYALSPGGSLDLTRSRIVSLLGVSLLGILLVNFAVGAAATQRSRRSSVSQASCIELGRYLEFPNTCAHAPPRFRKSAQDMYALFDRLGLREIRRNLHRVDEPAPPVGRVESAVVIRPRMREFLPTRSFHSRFEDRVVLHGTIDMPTDESSYRSIALSHGGSNSFFALGSVAEDQSWMVEFTSSLLPVPAVVDAWLYDRVKGTLLRLEGKVERSARGITIIAPGFHREAVPD